MTNNLFVSYRLGQGSTDEKGVIAAIEALGPAVSVQPSCWYARSGLSAAEAASAIWGAMTSSDSLLVVDASEGEAAWRNVDRQAAEFIKEEWRALGLSHACSPATGEKGAPQTSSART